MRAKLRYRFIERVGDKYYWEAYIRGDDSRVFRVICNVNWFWGKR